MSVARVVVIGAGPAGMAAAVRASECGAQVRVVDDNPGAGGQIWRAAEHPNPWFKRLNGAGIAVLPDAQVVSADRKTLLVETQHGSQDIPFDRLILATGAREIFLPFPGWTLPGIMGAGGLQALAKSGLPIRGKRIVVAGSGPLLLAVAAYLREHGAIVTLLAEQAKRVAVMSFAAGLVGRPAKLAQAIRLQTALIGISQRHNCWVEAAEGAVKLERLRIRQGGKTWTEECDFAAIGYGLSPNIELASLLECGLSGQAIAVDEFQTSSVAGVYGAGECTGIGGVDLAVIEGEIAGYAACGDFQRARSLFGKRERARKFAAALNKTFALSPELRLLPTPATLVCRCEDVSFLELQAHHSFRAAKLHTRCGMGPCQGRVCGPATHFLLGWHTDSFRPPIFAARIGTLLTESEILEESTETT